MMPMGRFVSVDDPGPGGSAMADDTSALYWYDSDTLTGFSGVWADSKPGGFDLSAHTTYPTPVLNASGDGLDFNGAQVLANLTTGVAGRMSGALVTGGVYIAFVARLGALAGDVGGEAGAFQPAEVEIEYHPFGESSTDSGIAQNFLFTYQHNSFAGNQRTWGFWRAAGSSNHKIQYPDGAVDLDQSNEKALWELYYHPSVPVMTLYKNGVEVFTRTVSPDRYPNTSNLIICMGGRGSTTSVGGFFKGTIFEVFSTADVSPANRAAIRAELQTKHGL